MTGSTNDASVSPIDGWRVTIADIDATRTRWAATATALSNGAIGVRGVLDEQEGHGATTLLARVYETSPIHYHERHKGFAGSTDTRVPVADAANIAITVDGTRIAAAGDTPLANERILDMATGTLTRRTVWPSPAGPIVVTAARNVPIDGRCIAVTRYTIAPGQGSARIAVTSGLGAPPAAVEQGHDPRIGTANLRPLDLLSVDPVAATLVQRTHASGITVAAACVHDPAFAASVAVADGFAQTLEADARSDAPLSLVKAVAYADTAAQAQADATAALPAAPNDALAAFWADADLALDGKPITLATPAVFTRDGDAWRLATTRLAFAGGEASVGGRFGGGRGAIDATLSKMPLAILDIGYPGLGLLGNASGSLSVVTGAGPTTGKVNVTVRGLSRAGLVLSSRPIDMGLAAVLSADRLGARAVMASGGKTIGRAQAQLTLGTGNDLATRIDAAGLFAQLRYGGPADALWRLGGVELFDLSGPVTIAADVTGGVRAPAIRGVMQANGARLESGTTGTVFTNVQASGRFGGSALVIDRFAGDAGKGGHVTGGGRFDFAAAHGVGLDLTLKADHAALIARDDIAATVTGALTFRSDGSGGTVAGDVTLDRSRYRLGQASAASAVPQLDIREVNLPEGGEELDAPTKPWTLAIHAKAPNQLRVLGLGLDSEWSADLSIAGAPDDPAITGRATLIRGDYEFAGRKFTLDRGVIRFAGERPANPALDITANADSTGLNAQIRVTGVALKPEIAFTSVPALPQDELLSRLLFGTSITNLSAPEALQLAAAVASLQSGGKGGLNPINAVRRAAGLDRLRIVPADPQTGQGTSIAAGKYVTRRFYAEIVTDGQGYSATQTEFQVTRWLSILSSISTLGRQSASVRVSKDY